MARETKDVVERFEELDRMYYIFIQGLNDKIWAKLSQTVRK